MSARFYSVQKPATVVELVDEDAEFRMGEMRQQCVIYTRNNRFYVRTKAEFMAKFSPCDSGLTDCHGCKTP